MGADQLDFHRIRRRFRAPLRTSGGFVESVDRILLRGENAQGEIGYGEIAPWAGFKTESIDDAEKLLRSCQGSLSQLQRTVERSESALPCLAAALSMIASWGEIKKFGGSLRSAGLLGEGATPVDAATRISQGFTTLKLKIGPTTSVETVQAILGATPAHTTLRLDANGLLTLVPARAWIEFARREPRIEYVEQPLPVDHAGYVSLGSEKIALDESFTSPQKQLIGRGVIIVKPCLAGDWLTLRTWLDRHSPPVVFSSCFETAIGRQAALWLAAEISSPRVAGFDTLGWFEPDGRDRHTPGPIAAGLANYDWEKFWEDVA